MKQFREAVVTIAEEIDKTGRITLFCDSKYFAILLRELNKKLGYEVRFKPLYNSYDDLKRKFDTTDALALAMMYMENKRGYE